MMRTVHRSAQSGKELVEGLCEGLGETGSSEYRGAQHYGRAIVVVLRLLKGPVTKVLITAVCGRAADRPP